MPQMSEMQRDWARRGALVRLEEIDNERADILASFPDLRRPQTARLRASDGTQLKKRRKMSAAARRRMSEGMRKYWAKRKAGGKQIQPKGRP